MYLTHRYLLYIIYRNNQLCFFYIGLTYTIFRLLLNNHSSDSTLQLLINNKSEKFSIETGNIFMDTSSLSMYTKVWSSRNKTLFVSKNWTKVMLYTSGFTEQNFYIHVNNFWTNKLCLASWFHIFDSFNAEVLRNKVHSQIY